jgi:endonuclease YncB( thermonuclease family)
LPAPLVRPAAQLQRVIDGDTYVVALDIWGTGFEEADRRTVRLLDYGARELADKAPVDPKNLGRVTGPEAREIAEKLFAGVGPALSVEVKGKDKYGRVLAWLWLGEISLGAKLAELHAVAATSTKGLER